MVKLAPLVAAVAFVGSASAFAPASKTVSSSSAMSAMSKSMPFLEAPKNTAGWIGDAGFDPFGFSDYFDMKWMREAEIKNGRVAMLATVGFITSEFVTIPGYIHVDDSNLAPTVVGASAMLQIVLFGGVLEWYMNNGKITMEDMFSDPDKVPGEYGWGAKLLEGKTQEQIDLVKLQELKNGRLAMLAIGGMIHHNWVTGEPLL